MESDPAVIVVDDRKTGDRTARDLESAGYESVAVDASDADPAAICRRVRSEGSCVVTELDVGPHSGLDFVESVRAGRRNVGVVIYTDDGDESTASRAFTVGADEYVPKAEGIDALVGAIDRAVSRRTWDVSDEAELAWYRTVVETVGDMIYALDHEGRVILANDAFERHFGRSTDDIVGTDVSELIPDPAYEAGVQLLRALLGTEDTNHGRYEFATERADGSERELENNVTVLLDEDGSYRGSVGVIRDVTERAEQERLLEQQNDRLAEFASIVGHDLRNPLNVIAGRMDLLRETRDPSHIDEIEVAIERMEELLSNLLTLARQGKRVDELRPVSIDVVAVEAWRNVETTNGRLVLADDLGSVPADRGRLRQCFENLFRNAIEHGTDEGRVRSTDGRDDAAVTVTVERTGTGFAVSDDGPGVDLADPEALFERGYTTSADGTGLGLSIVHRIVEAHGWSIRVDETYEEGARFRIDTATERE